MLVTCFKTAVCLGALLLSATPVLSRIHGLAAETPPEPLKASDAPILEELRFTGLRHIAPAAVAAQLKSREGEPFDAAKIDKDLRALARLGWFESIQVEEMSPTRPPPQAFEHRKHMALIFHLEERPFLSKVQYSGSRLLSQKQIQKLFGDKQLITVLGQVA